MSLTLLAAATLVIGVCLGVSGYGGFLVPPLLVWVAGFDDPSRAVAHALVAATLPSLLGAWLYRREHRTPWPLVVALCAGTLPGVLAGRWLASVASDGLLHVLIGVAVLAAGIALVAGLGLGRLTGDAPATPEATDPGTVVAAADLTALDSDAARGVASAVEKDDTLTLRVSAEGLDDSDGVHEVWLINTDGKRMVAIGFLASGDTGQFDVPLGLIEQGYRIVDISVEPDDGDPTHSGVSLARGELA